MRERDPQRSVSAHRKASDAARGAFSANAIRVFDERHELVNKEIAVQSLAVARIDVKRVPAIRRNDQKIADFVVAAQILQPVHSPSTAIVCSFPPSPWNRYNTGYCRVFASAAE